MNNLNKNIIIVTGGTGGHIFPAITVGEYLSKKLFNVNFITDTRGLNNINLARLKPKVIYVKGFAGKTHIQKLTSIILMLIASLKVLFFLKNKKIDLILGFGSYVQVPVILAAKILNINIILHEGNLVLGNANKYFWRFAKVRASAFRIINSKKDFQEIGMPVRTKIEDLFTRDYKENVKRKKINILILGGSLGALILSRNVCKQICLLPINIKKRLHVVHQSKIEDITQINTNYLKNRISSEVKSFFSDIHNKLKTTTLVICRAGASTITENLIAGLPAIYVPLPNSIDNHQKHNAEMIKSNNAGWMILEDEISEPKFLELLTKLLSSGKLLEKISYNCKKISKPYASKNMHKLVLGVLNEKF